MGTKPQKPQSGKRSQTLGRICICITFAAALYAFVPNYPLRSGDAENVTVLRSRYTEKTGMVLVVQTREGQTLFAKIAPDEGDLYKRGETIRMRFPLSLSGKKLNFGKIINPR